MIVTFIDAHRGAYGVEPICAELPIAPATDHAHKARQADPTRRPARSVRDAELKTGDLPSLDRTPRRLRFPQGVAAVAAGGLCRGTVHRRAVDARTAAARCAAWPAG